MNMFLFLSCIFRPINAEECIDHEELPGLIVANPNSWLHHPCSHWAKYLDENKRAWLKERGIDGTCYAYWWQDYRESLHILNEKCPKTCKATSCDDDYADGLPDLLDLDINYFGFLPVATKQIDDGETSYLKAFTGHCRSGSDSSYQIIRTFSIMTKHWCYHKCKKTEGCTAFSMAQRIWKCSLYKNGPYTKGDGDTSATCYSMAQSHSYYVKFGGQCPKNHQIRDTTECEHAFTMIEPEKQTRKKWKFSSEFKEDIKESLKTKIYAVEYPVQHLIDSKPQGCFWDGHHRKVYVKTKNDILGDHHFDEHTYNICNGEEEKGMKIWLIIVIIIATLVIVTIGIVLCVYCSRKQNRTMAAIVETQAEETQTEDATNL